MQTNQFAYRTNQTWASYNVREKKKHVSFVVLQLLAKPSAWYQRFPFKSASHSAVTIPLFCESSSFRCSELPLPLVHGRSGTSPCDFLHSLFPQEPLPPPSRTPQASLLRPDTLGFPALFCLLCFQQEAEVFVRIPPSPPFKPNLSSRARQCSSNACWASVVCIFKGW